MVDSCDGQTLEDAYLAAMKGNLMAAETAARGLALLAMRYGTQMPQLDHSRLAEDAAQEAVCCALTTSYPWQPGGARLSTWFFTVWKNAALRILSKHSAGPVQIVDPQTLEKYHAAAGDVELELRDGIQFVRRALLTEPEYEVFARVVVADMTIPEVREELCRSHDHVRTLWRHARDIVVLYLLHLDDGMREEEIEKVYPAQPNGPTGHERLRRALKLLRERPGAWRVARRLIAEQKWSVAEIAETWSMSQEQLNRGLQDDQKNGRPT